MKTKLILIIPMMVLGTILTAQTDETKNVKKAVEGFIKAGDNSDADKVATYLDDNYRVVMNRLFGSDAVSVVTKDEYVEK